MDIATVSRTSGRLCYGAPGYPPAAPSMFVDATSIFIVVGGGGLIFVMMRSTLADFLKLGGILGKAFGAGSTTPSI